MTAAVTPGDELVERLRTLKIAEPIDLDLAEDVLRRLREDAATIAALDAARQSSPGRGGGDE